MKIALPIILLSLLSLFCNAQISGCKYQQDNVDKFTGLRTAVIQAGQINFIREGDSLLLDVTLPIIDYNAALLGGPLSKGLRQAGMPAGTPFYIALATGDPIRLELERDAGVSGDYAVAVMKLRCRISPAQLAAMSLSPVQSYRAQVTGHAKSTWEDNFTPPTRKKSTAAARCLIDAS